jgi:hypothetical protein
LDKSEVYFPPLHIKLSLIEIFVLAVDKDCEGFACLRQKFPKISETKMKEGIFISPQTKQLFRDQDYGTNLNSPERRA